MDGACPSSEPSQLLSGKSRFYSQAHPYCKDRLRWRTQDAVAKRGSFVGPAEELATDQLAHAADGEQSLRMTRAMASSSSWPHWVAEEMPGAGRQSIIGMKPSRE